MKLVAFFICFYIVFFGKSQNTNPYELQNARELIRKKLNGLDYERGNKSNDLKQGEWIGYNSNGTIIYKETFKNGLLEGSSYDYYSDGSLSSKIDYKNGLFNGWNIHCFPSGQISSKTYYENGVKNGESIIYFKDGSIDIIENYRSGNLDGYFQNVHVNFTERGYYKLGFKVGEWRELYLFNNFLTNFNKWLYGYQVGNYVNDNKEGQWTLKYASSSNGTDTLTSIGCYQNNLQEGKWITYHSNGKVKYLLNFELGLLNGLFTEYSNDEQILQTGYFKNQIKDSIWVVYSDDKIREKGLYVKGEKHGVWLERDYTSNILYKCTYDLGKFLFKEVSSE